MTVLPRRSFKDTSLPFSSCKVNSGALSWRFMGISLVRSGWGRADASARTGESRPPARHWLGTILYRGTLFTLLACFVAYLVAGGILAQAQEERPEFIPGERKVPRKKDAGPRALAILQMTASGKVTLVPVAILVNGKFWDASAYKANPVPMALETGTVYEGERTGSSVGLFTIGSALHSLAVNTQVPWIGTGSWLAQGKDAPNKAMKAESVPVGIDNSDEPPRLSKGGSSSGSKPASDKPAGDKSGTTSGPSSSSSPSGSSSPSSSSSGSSSSGDEPPRLSRPAQSSGSGNAGSTPTNSAPSTQSAPGSSAPSSSTPSSSTPSSSTPASPSDSKSSDDKSSSDKSSDDKPTLKRPDQNSEQNPGQNPGKDKSSPSTGDKASSEPKPPESDSGAGAGYRPRLRRGKPTTSFADEEIPGYGRLGATVSKGSKAPAASSPAQEIIDLVPAISDAASNELHAFNFNWLKDEEGERRKQIEGIAKQDVQAYVNAHATATPTPVRPGTAKAQAHTPVKKGPEPILENVKMVAYDLWGNNTPVIVFSADAHFPPPPSGTAQSGVPDLQYSVMLVMRPDIYDTLKTLYAGITDRFHLDLTPRLQLIDAVDADGDGRGELLFKEVSDAGTGWILYRASADKLWKMFDSLSPE
jgi:hypothetical protein